MKVVYVNENKEIIKQFSTIEEIQTVFKDNLDVTKLYFVTNNEVEIFVKLIPLLMLNEEESEQYTDYIPEFDDENCTVKIYINPNHFENLQSKFIFNINHTAKSLIHNAKESALKSLEIDKTVAFISSIHEAKQIKLTNISNCKTTSDLIQQLVTLNDWPVY